jgi:hypothetical protein
MKPLTRKDLMSLEEYAVHRPHFRKAVIEHKKHRRISIGQYLHLYFEDRLTVQYQIQEMLRIEKIFEAAGIEEELETYNPLIPDGKNLKATAMLEYQDVEERKQKLALLRNIEDMVWLQVQGHDRVYAISNEDLGRSNDEKTSAVHFMRFELDNSMRASMQNGDAVTLGCSHEFYSHQTLINAAQQKALLGDFVLAG